MKYVGPIITLLAFFALLVFLAWLVLFRGYSLEPPPFDPVELHDRLEFREHPHPLDVQPLPPEAV